MLHKDFLHDHKVLAEIYISSNLGLAFGHLTIAMSNELYFVLEVCSTSVLTLGVVPVAWVYDACIYDAGSHL